MMGQENKEKQIRAVYTDTTIRVYQAYCLEIAEEVKRLDALRHQGVDILGLLPKEEIYVGP